MYPGSGVVLDCIDSWSLHPYLLWLSELFCLCCVAALKVSPQFNLMLLLFQSSGLCVNSHSTIPVAGYPLCLVSWVRCGTNCINSWSLHPYLLWLSELFCLCCMAALKVSSYFHLMLLIFQSSGLCVQSPSIIPVPGYPLCLVSWVRCGTWLYRFLIFAPLLILAKAPPLSPSKGLDPGLLKCHLICFNIYCTSTCILKTGKNNYNVT